MKYNNVSKNKIIKNGLYLYILTFSNYFIGLLLFPYISRVLSVEGFGLVGFSMAYVLVFQVIVEFGFMISATAKISKNRTDLYMVSEIISSTMLAKIILSLISIFIFCLSAIFVPTVRDHSLIVFLFLVSAILAAMVPDFYFRGIENMKTIAIRTIVIRSISLILIVALVDDDSQILLIPSSFIFGNLIALTVTLVAMHKKGTKFRKVKIKQAIDSIINSFMFFLSRIAVTIHQFVGAFLIGFKFSPTSLEAGLFTGATRISLASEMMLMPVSDSLYPHMVNKKDYGLFRRVVTIGGVIWFFACLFVFIFANYICGFILGPDYNAAGDLLRILLFGNFIAFFSNMFGYNALVPIGKSNQANIALLVSAGLSLLAYGLLWALDSINLISVCTVMAFANFTVFGYRGTVFWSNRHLTRNI